MEDEMDELESLLASLHTQELMYAELEAEKMSAEMAAAYYRAAWMGQKPPFVPSRVRVLTHVRGDFPYMGKGVEPGEYACDSNTWGAVWVWDQDGKMLGLLPKEFEPLAWRESA